MNFGEIICTFFQYSLISSLFREKLLRNYINAYMSFRSNINYFDNVLLQLFLLQNEITKFFSYYYFLPIETRIGKFRSLSFNKIESRLLLIFVAISFDDGAIRGVFKERKTTKPKEREGEGETHACPMDHDVITNRLFVFPRNVTLICPNLNKFHGRCCS